MRLPNGIGLALLFCLLVLLPWLAFRSAQQLREARADAPGAPPLPSRSRIFTGTLILLVSLFVLAWFTGRTFGYEVFSIHRLGLREVLAGCAALVGCFGFRALSQAMRSETERRNMPVYALMPKTRTEWLLYLATAVVAGISEETAYRGVGMALLTWATGNAVLSVIVLSIAFGLAHLAQEWKSVAIVVLMALLMHGLVAFTGTLVIAMAVHAGYDVVAGILGSRDAERYGPAASP